MIHASQLNPWNVGEESTFSPYRARKVSRIASFVSPAVSRSRISFFIGSPDPHCRWLQAWTVRPQPH